MTTIVHKRGTGIPSADDLAVGEIAIDTDTGIAYTLTDDGEVCAVGGDSIWTEVPEPDASDYRWVTLKDQAVGDDEYGFRIQYSTKQADPENPDPDFPNGPWDNAELKVRKIKAFRSEINTAQITTLAALEAQAVEQQIFGGIQILGADAERPDGLPYSPDEKSVQYALTVGHETLGRTVVIDKEGIIRARDFTDLDGNSIIRGDVDLSTYVTTDPDIQDGEYAFWGQYNKFKWIPDIHTGRGGKYWVEIGQGVGEGGAGSGYAALYIENSAGSFEVNYYSVLMTSMDLIGQSGSKISGFESVQASDFLDADGNSIIGAGGGGDPEWALVGSDVEHEKVIAFGAPSDTTIVDQECIAIGFECEARYRSVAIGHGSEAGDEGIALGRNAEAGPDEFAISPNIDSVNFSNARVQAQDYLDADGNSIIGGGGGDVDLTGYATETWVSTNYQTKGNYLVSADLNGYATETWVTNGYQPKGNYLTDFTESDPTVPAWVKSITQNDIDNWNSAGGDFDNSHVVGDESKKNVAVGLRALRDLTEGSNNTATGTDALTRCTTGIGNTAYGSECLTFLESGEWNTAVGVRALKNSSSAKHNSVFGYQAAYNLRTGRDNVAIGSYAFEASRGGQKNVAVGCSALKKNDDSYCTAIGYAALQNSVAGSNTAVGHESLLRATTGILNVAVGNSALVSNVEGSSNTAIGRNAGFWLTGNKNSVLGADAGPNYGRPDIENTTCVGFGAETIESNTIKLGNRDITRVITDGAMQASDYLDADGNPATVSPSAIVQAFTTLQTAVADEDTVEGIRTALTNALGGLIEKFEGMSK